MYGSYEKVLQNRLLAAFSEGNKYNQEPMSRSPTETWSRPFPESVLFKRLSWDLLRNNSQITNQRRAVTMDALLYLQNHEAVTMRKF